MKSTHCPPINNEYIAHGNHSENFYHSWPLDEEIICKKIRSAKTLFKVILKTKDEDLLLPIWLNHYRSFLNADEIIIADNYSTKKSTLDIYNQLDSRITIFQYKADSNNGFHNIIHDRQIFFNFYAAIKESCYYYIHVDSDELLILAKQNRWANDRKTIIKHIEKSDGKFQASASFETITGSLDTIQLDNNTDRIINAIKWGKPIIPSFFTDKGFLIHNAQYPSNLFTANDSHMFILLHLKNYSMRQRLFVNRLKLDSRGLVTDTTPFETIAQMDMSTSFDPTAKRLAIEISELLNADNLNTTNDTLVDYVKFDIDGHFTFSGHNSINTYQNLLSNFRYFTTISLSSKQNELSGHDEYDPSNKTTDDFIKDWHAACLTKNFVQAENILRTGIEMYPETLDQHNSPFFCKELLRLLLSKNLFSEAYDLINLHGMRGEDGWYHIIFARAYDITGDYAQSRKHWLNFSKNRPHHAETNSALKHYISRITTQPFKRILEHVPCQNFSILFDIGANVGQSCITYANQFPGAIIHAFEPSPETYQSLTSATSNMKSIHAHNFALSNSSDIKTMSTGNDSTMNRIVKDDSPSASNAKGIPINCVTLYDFCSENYINHIDFMKIDTEGHDLEVLHGCKDFISNIDFIQCEASANRYNQFHNSFFEIFEFLSDAGFHLFDIHGFTYEWANGGYPVLRRFDPIFINARIVGEMRNVINR